jgi:hypothetical protein
MSELIRLRIVTERADDALKLLREAGFEPSRIDDRCDGEMRFEFKDVPDDQVYSLAASVPRSWFAIQAIVGDPPFGGPDA